MADKPLCCGMHRFGIERARHAPSAILVECKVGAAVDDAIKVMPFDGGEPGVEVRRRAFRGQHHDRLRAQVEIDGVAHGLSFTVLGEIDMRDLAQSVHAGVGPSGGADYNPLGGEGRNRIGEDGLHLDAVVLRLPANKKRAVIFDRELIARHRRVALNTQCKVLARGIDVPRRNSSTRIGWRPERCNSRSRIAPSPQAMVKSSSSTRPGSPVPLPFVVRRTLIRPVLGYSNQAPGNGESPRQWSWTLFHDWLQSIRVSLFSILLA